MTALKPHQIASARFKVERGRTLDLSEMGTGKTLAAIALFAATKERTLIICPSYLKRNWEAEAKKFLKVPPDIKVLEKIKGVDELSRHQILIASYEALAKLETEYKTRPCVILDEAHYITNLRSNRSRFFHSFNVKYPPKYLCLLTGTPIRNAIPDLYSLLAAVNPDNFLKRFPKFWPFARHFSTEVVRYMGSIKKVDFEGVRNTEELKALLASCSVRYRLSDIADLPGYAVEHVTLPDDNLPADVTERLWADYKEWNETEDANLANYATAKAFSALAKVDDTIKYIRDLWQKMPDEPLVVFSDHTMAASKLAEAFGAYLITGATPNARRHAFVTGFQAGEKNMIVGTIKAMGTGITLHRARICLFNDLHWVPAENAQAEKRIHRIGQERKCLKIVLSSGPIDRRINEVICRKTAAISQILN